MLRRVGSVVLPTGIAVWALGLVCGVLGLLLSWRELLIVAVASALLSLLCIPWIIGRFPLSMSRSIDPPRAALNEKAVAILEARNPTSKPVATKSVEDRLGDLVVPVRLPVLLPDQQFEVPYTLPTDRRGAFPLGPVTMVRSDPVGLFRREREHGGVDTFWVHPRIHELASLPTGLARDLEGPTSQNSPAGGIAFHTIREYEYGDDYRHIHWRSTAKTGTLMVRHYVDNRRPHLTLVLDDRLESYSSPDEFELAIEAAASITAATLRSEYPLSAYSLSVDFSAVNGRAHRDEWLDRFAEVEGTDDHNLTELVHRAAQSNSGTTIFALVTGSQLSEELLGLVSLVRNAQRTLLVRAHTNGTPEPFSIPGSAVVDIANGQELQSAWSQIVRA